MDPLWYDPAFWCFLTPIWVPPFKFLPFRWFSFGEFWSGAYDDLPGAGPSWWWVFNQPPIIRSFIAVIYHMAILPCLKSKIQFFWSWQMKYDEMTVFGGKRTYLFYDPVTWSIEFPIVYRNGVTSRRRCLRLQRRRRVAIAMHKVWQHGICLNI